MRTSTASSGPELHEPLIRAGEAHHHQRALSSSPAPNSRSVIPVTVGADSRRIGQPMRESGAPTWPTLAFVTSADPPPTLGINGRHPSESSGGSATRSFRSRHRRPDVAESRALAAACRITKMHRQHPCRGAAAIRLFRRSNRRLQPSREASRIRAIAKSRNSFRTSGAGGNLNRSRERQTTRRARCSS